MFSFDGYRQLDFRMPWTMVWVVVVLGVAELCLGSLLGSAPTASALEWYESPKALSARVRFLEREVVRGDARVVVLGSSRAAMGIHPASFERALGLPDGSSWNLGLVGGGRPFDTRYVAERFLSRAADLDWVVVAIDEFTLNRAHAHGELFREHAPFPLRWSEAEAPWSASLDGVSRLRRRAPQMVEAARAFEAGERDLDLWVTSARQVRFRSWGGRREVVTPESSRRIADRYFRDYELNRAAASHFGSIVERVERLGGRCVFITLPSHPRFRVAVEDGYRAEHAEMGDALASWSEQVGVPLLRFDGESYPAEWFRDAVHLTEAGSQEFSRRLGEALRSL